MLRWINSPAPALPGNPVRLLWARLNEPAWVALLEEPRELQRHRHCGSAVLCPGPDCRLCLSGIEHDNRWYAAAMYQPIKGSSPHQLAWQRCAWELTPDQAQFWPRKHDRAVIVRTERIGHAKGPIRLTYVSKWLWEPAPEAFPIDAVLERVFRVNAQVSDQKQRGER